MKQVNSELVLDKSPESVVTITLNRPERLNAMSRSMLQGLLSVLDDLASQNSARAIVLTGSGRGFCVGGDLTLGLKEITGAGSIPDQTRELRAFMRIAELLYTLPIPTIAAINGPCAGAGLALACACDIRLASDSAVFATGFVTAGVSGDFGGTWTLSRIIGPARARELYLSSDKISASDAHRIGLVSAIHPPDSLLAEAASRAIRLASMAPLAMGAIKANLNQAAEVGFVEMLDHEAVRHVECTNTEDASEAAAAFVAKRRPVFNGR
jgi:2-(1,2-epoxy-1,2-dihydrophenyl)acetyl-CoA isomerase